MAQVVVLKRRDMREHLFFNRETILHYECHHVPAEDMDAERYYKTTQNMLPTTGELQQMPAENFHYYNMKNLHCSPDEAKVTKGPLMNMVSFYQITFGNDNSLCLRVAALPYNDFTAVLFDKRDGMRLDLRPFLWPESMHLALEFGEISKAAPTEDSLNKADWWPPMQFRLEFPSEFTDDYRYGLFYATKQHYYFCNKMVTGSGEYTRANIASYTRPNPSWKCNWNQLAELMQLLLDVTPQILVQKIGYPQWPTIFEDLRDNKFPHEISRSMNTLLRRDGEDFESYYYDL